MRRRCFRRRCRPTRPVRENQTTGPNGLIERQVTRELLDLFNIDEQTLNTEGLQVTTTIDPKAQKAAEEAVTKYLDGQDPDMRAAVVSIDPKTGGVKAYYGGSDANGFDFAQAGLPTGSSFKVFALVAALEQGIGLGYQVDSSPVNVNGIKITNVEGEGCGTCNIAEALKRSLNTSYYRLMLKLKNGPSDVADAAHAGRHRRQLPRRRPHAVRGRQGRPAQQRNRVGPVPDSADRHGVGVRHAGRVGRLPPPHFVQKVVNSEGQVLFDASRQDNSGEQRIDKAVADNVTAAMQPIAGYSNGHNLAGGRLSAAKTGTNQLGDTGANRDAWMVGFTPSLSTAVWVGTTEGTKPLENKSGRPGVGLGAAVRHLEVHDGRRAGGHRQRDVPEADRDRRLRGRACRAAAAASPAPPEPRPETVIQPSIEVAPGITIPFGPPTDGPGAAATRDPGAQGPPPGPPPP